MRTRLRLCAVSLAALVLGKDIPNPQVQATGVQVAIPASLITPAPVLHGDIFKRSIATCGFIRGNSGTSVFTLGKRSTSKAEQHYLLHVQRTTTASLHRTLSPDLHAAITSSVIRIGLHAGRTVRPTAWVMPSQRRPARPYLVRSFNGTPHKSFAIDRMLTVDYSSSESQQCFRYARSTSLGATDTYYSWACGTTSDDILVLATMTNGGAVQTADSDTTGFDDLLQSITGGSLPPSASNNPSGGSSSSPISTTAIALISVAGIAVLVIALLLGYFCWWRKRYRENNNVVQQSKPSQLTYEPTVTQGPRTEIIPSWSGRTPFGANPNVPPSEAPSDYVGPTASEIPRPMSTVYEQGNSYGNRRH
jgi:hypothetical protein